MKRLPEFSTKNYKTAGYIVATAITISGLWLIYQILFHSDISFSANWNMFDSVLMWPLYIIGLIVMFANWSKFSIFSFDTYEKTTYEDGRVEVKRNWDIMEWMLGHVIFPLFGRFFLVPVIVAAIIYYPLMCIVHLIGAVFPYIVSLIIICIIVVSWKFTSWFQFRYHSILIVLIGIFFTAIFAVSGYKIEKPHNPRPPKEEQPTINTPRKPSDDSKPTSGNTNGTPDDIKIPEDPNNGGDDSDEFDNNPTTPTTYQGGGGSTPCDGLLGLLPNGTTEYKGDMAGFPIEFIITKKEENGELSAVYKNIKYGATMKLKGEPVSNISCDVRFLGKVKQQEWTFTLSGTTEEIIGKAQSNDGKDLKVHLHKKEESEDEFD